MSMRLNAIKRKNNIIKEHNILRCPDDQKKRELIKEAHSLSHDPPIIMVDRIHTAGFTWNNIFEDAKQLYHNCITCAQYNPKCTVYHSPQQVVATAPMQHVQMDLAGPFKSLNNGNIYALIYTCVYTGYVIIRPIKNKEASTIALEVSKIWCDYSPPVIIQSDNGTEFKNKLLADIIEEVKTALRYSAAYNPRTNGKVESKVGQFKMILEKLVSNGNSKMKISNWDLFAPLVQLAINSRTSSVTKYSPFFLMFNREPRGIIEGNYNTVPMLKFNVTDWLKNWETHYGAILDSVMSNRSKIWDSNSSRWMISRVIQEENIPIGTRVMVSLKDKVTFTPRRVGPFWIKDIDEFRNYYLSTSPDPEATLLKRKFARDMLFIIPPDSNIGLGLEPIVGISSHMKSDPLDSGDFVSNYFVRFGDTELEDSWVSEALIPKNILTEYHAFPPDNKKIFQVPINILQSCYNLNEIDARAIISEADFDKVPMCIPI